MEKVYCVFIDKGSWDSHTYRLDKVFSDEDKADEYVSKITKEIKAKQALMPKDLSEDEDFKGDYEVAHEKYKEEMKMFSEQYRDWYDWYEFNECIVEEFEIN